MAEDALGPLDAVGGLQDELRLGPVEGDQRNPVALLIGVRQQRKDGALRHDHVVFDAHAAAGVEDEYDQVRDLALPDLLANVPFLESKRVALRLRYFALDLMDCRRPNRGVECEGMRPLFGNGAAHIPTNRVGIRHARATAHPLALGRLDELGRYLPDAKGGPGLINPGRISLSCLVFFGQGSGLGRRRCSAFGALRLHLRHLRLHAALQLTGVTARLIEGLLSATMGQGEHGCDPNVLGCHLVAALVGGVSHRCFVHDDVGTEAVDLEVRADPRDQVEHRFRQNDVGQQLHRVIEPVALFLLGLLPEDVETGRVELEGGAAADDLGPQMRLPDALDFHRKGEPVEGQRFPAWAFM